MSNPLISKAVDKIVADKLHEQRDHIAALEAENAKLRKAYEIVCKEIYDELNNACPDVEGSHSCVMKDGKPCEHHKCYMKWYLARAEKELSNE